MPEGSTNATLTTSEVVHLKGFASGLTDDPETLERCRSDIMRYLTTSRPRTLVWDGDELADDSFTFLIPLIADAMPETRLVAYKLASEKDVFHQSWDTTGLSIELRLVPGPAPDECYEYLGLEALKDTGSTTILCFGGGGVVQNEYSQAPAGCVYHWWPARRRVKEGAEWQNCALAGCQSATGNLVCHIAGCSALE